MNRALLRLLCGSAIAVFALLGRPVLALDRAREDAILARLAQDASGETLELVIHGVEGHEATVRAFQRKYPEIHVHVTVQNPSTMGPRIISEQRAGLFLWDSWWAATTAMTTMVVPAGGFEPLTKYIEIPDILDPATWRAPKYMFSTEAGPYVFIHSNSVESNVFFNRSVVKGLEIRDEADLLDPRLRGKIAMRDLAGGTTGASYMLASLLRSKGPKFVRRLLLEQRPALFANARQLTDAVVRGDYAVVLGGSPDTLLECQSLGGCKSVEALPFGQSVLSRGVGILKNPPHPKAAKLWVNWLLSRQGQEVYVEQWAKYQTTGASSMRKDVEPDPRHLSTIPDYTRMESYGLYGYQAGQADLNAANALFAQVRRQLGEPVPTSAWVVIALTAAGLLILSIRKFMRFWRQKADRFGTRANTISPSRFS